MDVLEPDPLAVLLAGASPARDALAGAIERARGSHRTLVEGPLGAGHGRVARALHRRAGQAEVPFAELHGDRAETLDRLLEGGLRGTVVLRRVDRMAPEDQAELAAAIDGPTRWTRLIATLEHESGSHPRGDLDPDLDYQLGVTCVVLPSLSDRREDLPALAAAAVAAASREYGRGQVALGPAALNHLRELPLRGELEELELHLRLAVLSGDAEALDAARLPDHTLPAAPAPGRTLAEVERAHVESTLRATRGNRARAARELGINRSTLYNKLRSWSGEE